MAAGPGYLQPMPGVPRGDAALGPVSKTEAERRCKVVNPSGGELARYRVGMRGGMIASYGEPTQRAVGSMMCLIPGDSQPTRAGRALLRSGPLPTDDAGLLLKCSLQVWHDVRSWRIITKDTAPGMITSLIARSPSGRYVARCSVMADSSLQVSGDGISPADPVALFTGPNLPSPLQQLKYSGGSGSKCPLFGVRCQGSVMFETSWTDPKVARIVYRSSAGTHAITVRDGWFALAWNDRSGHLGLGAHLTAYDKTGKVLLTQ